YAAAIVTASTPEVALAFASAPRERSNRTFSASATAAIKIVVPFSVLLLGSRPESNNAASCVAVPNIAVRNHDGALKSAPGIGCASMGASGSAVNSAITAQQLPAYEMNSSFA